MEIILGAKKGRGIDDLIDKYHPNQVEEASRVLTSGKSIFVDLLEKYTKLKELPEYSDPESWMKGESLYKKMSGITAVLNPQELRAFLSVLNIIEEKVVPHQGLFLTKLIQNSYDAGYNNFSLDHEDKAIIHVGSFLRGREDNPLTMNIEKARGLFYAHGAEYINMTVEVSVFGYAERIRNSSLTILGDAATGSGRRSFRTAFHVTGDTHGDLAEYARESSYLLDGEFKTAPSKRWIRDSAPQQCTFKSPRPATVDTLLDYIPSGNRIVLIHADGREEIVRDYND